MSMAQSFPPGQGSGERPPGLAIQIDLGSKNPFRNRPDSVSPANDFFGNTLSPSTASPFDDPLPSGRPLSRNPFLDPVLTNQPQPLVSPGAMSANSDRVTSLTAEELFDSITLTDDRPRRPSGDMDSLTKQLPPRPPRRDGKPSDPNHRPSRSKEDAMRARKLQAGGPRRPGGPSQSPHKRSERRPRRNSDSSLLIDFEKPLTEEEKKARDARRREREKKSRPSRPSRKVDLIDQLDATSVYGFGAFHHDGPFDACNPHRNRKGSRRAPMSAFAEGSLNNSIGGSGPLNARPDHKRLMGTADEDAFRDFAGVASVPKVKPQTEEGFFDATSRGDILHGDESLGLGTSTFLEGTPVARTILQKREAEQAQELSGGGLQRKKSLAQRIRGINRVPGGRPGEGGRRPTYPELPELPRDFIEREASNDAGPNNEFSQGPESITVKRWDTGSAGSLTSPVTRPRNVSVGLERRSTADGITTLEDASGKQAGGFLARVKSLKGGPRRPRQQEESPSPPPTAPGMAV